MSARTKFRAYDGHILVQHEKASQTTDAGLVVPISAQKKQTSWEVLDVGEGVANICPGDRVVYKDSSVFLGGNVIVKDHAVFVDVEAGIISVRKDNVVAILKKEDL